MTVTADTRSPGPRSAGDPLGWTPSDLARVGARTLGDLYTSPAVWQAEQRSVLSRAWTLAAASEELAPGHYTTLTIGGAPIVVIRDRSGECRAFHNLCRHRGLPVLEGAGPLGRYITCPYHQWSFTSTGDLVNVPQPEQFPGMDPAQLGLLRAGVVEWHGMIFVSPAADACDFAPAVAPLERRLAHHLGADLVQVATRRYTVAGNWKFLVENHIDVYHLWYLHQQSLRDYEHRSFEWAWEGATWWSWEPLKDRSRIAASGTGAPIGGLDRDEMEGIGAHLLFPNLMIVTTADLLGTYDARPTGPETTEVTLRLRAAPGTDGEPLVASVRRFLSEDIRACELLQVGARSPRFGLGPLAADHESPLVTFHEQLRSGIAP